MKARKISNTGSKKVIGKFPSLKMDSVIWWESQIERDYIYLLEIDPDVLEYRSQPFKIVYADSDKSRKYTPDFWVKRIDKQQIVEVKPASVVEREKNINLWRHIAAQCLEKGLEFVVVTDAMIRVQPLLNNIKLLYKYARTSLTEKIILECQRYFSNKNPTPLFQAWQDLNPIGISKNKLYKLIYLGFLVTDLMQPISSESLIQLSQFKGEVLALPKKQ